MKNYTRLPLRNASNVRELGGYPSKKGSVTNYGYLLRADDLSKLDRDDIDFLLQYGLSAVIDLRSDSEIITYPDPFNEIENVNYIHIPLIEQDVIDPIFNKNLMKNPANFLCEMYLGIIKNATDGIKEVIDFIAQQEATILYHCTAGKDRTGIISMLLLGLAGVSKEDIISNYMVTEIYIKEAMKKLENVDEFPKELGMSKPEYIEPVVDYIIETYSSFEDYLLYIGIERNVLDILKLKLNSNEAVCSEG